MEFITFEHHNEKPVSIKVAKKIHMRGKNILGNFITAQNTNPRVMGLMLSLLFLIEKAGQFLC